MTQALSSDPTIQFQAFNLRSAGATCQDIANALNLPTSNVAYRAVHNYARLNGVTVPGASNRSAAARRSHAARGTARASRGPLTARRFGVEIEVVGLSPAAAARALRAAGIDARDESYGHATRGYWKVTTDSSVNGCEVVSPPMSGDTAFGLLKTVCATLQAAGGRVDRSTGVHVHHEVTDLSGDELGRLVMVFVEKRTTMDALVAPSRRLRQGSYPCGALDPHEARRFADAFRQSNGNRRAVRSYGIGGRPDSRYRTLNVHSYANYGTVEFRQHQGTLNAAKIIAWVRFGQALIESVRAAAAIADEGADFIQALTGFGLPTETADFLTTRIAALA